MKSTIDQLELQTLWFDGTQCNAHQALAAELEKLGRYSEATKVYQSALANITQERAENPGVGSSIPLFKEAIARLKKKEREEKR